jgi:hypothetical protein
MTGEQGQKEDQGRAKEDPLYFREAPGGASPIKTRASHSAWVEGTRRCYKMFESPGHPHPLGLFKHKEGTT